MVACGQRSVSEQVTLPGTDATVRIEDPAFSHPQAPTSPFAFCSGAMAPSVDYRDLPSCVELFSKLAACCRTTELVKTYVFQILLHGCEPRASTSTTSPATITADPADDEVCKRLLVGRLPQECAYLKTQPTCDAEPRSCSGFGLKGGGGGCSLSAGCRGASFRVDCEAAAPNDEPLCKCTTNGVESESFRNTTICAPSGMSAKLFRVNEACGWDIKTGP